MAFKDLTLEEWKQEIEEGLRYRAKFGMEDEWHEIEAIFFSAHDSLADAGPNLLAATGDAMLSALTVPNPTITLKPTRPSAVDSVRIVEKVDNDLVKDLDLRVQLEDAVLAAYLWGRGFIKIGYDSEFGYDPRLEVTEGSGLTLSQFDSRGRRIEFGPAKPGMPWAKSVLPHDIVVPWGARDLDSTPWVAHRVTRHIEDLRADQKYSNTRSLQPTLTLEDFTMSYSMRNRPFKHAKMATPLTSGGGRGKKEYVELWEIHDQRTGRIKVLATGHDKFLRNEVDLLQVKGLPFVSIGFTPKARSFWVTPDAFYLLPLQFELADISYQAQKQRRIAVTRFLYLDGAIEDEELGKILTGRVGIGAKVKAGHDLDKAIRLLNPSSNNQQLWADAEQVRRDAREIVGFSRNQFGEFDASSRRTASEAQIVDRASSQRMSRRLIIISESVVKLFRKINTIISRYWTTPRVAEIIGEDGVAQWIEFTGEDLQGDFRYDITFTNEPIDSQQSRTLEALQLYQLLIQDPTVDQVALRKFLVRAMNDPDFSSVFKPEILSGGPQNQNEPFQLAQAQAQVQGGGQGGGGQAGQTRLLGQGG